MKCLDCKWYRLSQFIGRVCCDRWDCEITPGLIAHCQYYEKRKGAI